MLCDKPDILSDVGFYERIMKGRKKKGAKTPFTSLHPVVSPRPSQVSD